MKTTTKDKVNLTFFLARWGTGLRKGVSAIGKRDESIGHLLNNTARLI
jgi:hypothetical protein